MRAPSQQRVPRGPRGAETQLRRKKGPSPSSPPPQLLLLAIHTGLLLSSARAHWMSSSECGLLVEQYGIRPGFSCGDLPKLMKQNYTTSDCDVKVCDYWQHTYSVVPYVSWGSLPDHLRPSWEWVRPAPFGRTCNSLLTDPLGAASCGALVEMYGIRPGCSWGIAGSEQVHVYNSSGCDAKVCEYWKPKYGIQPHVSWGSLPKQLRLSWEWRRPAWGNRSCNGLSTGAEVFNLVRRFAPVLKFSSDACSYPITAQTYYDAGCHKKECSMDEWLSKPRDPQAHVYFGVNTCGSQVRIKYHFFYAWQPPCVISPISEVEIIVGAHQADWETVTVILSEDRSRVAAVSYNQHGGWYTRVAGRKGFETEDGKPVVYVGQTAHGCYHDPHTSEFIDVQSCAYFGDLRGDGIRWDVGEVPLVELTADSNESWIAATVAEPRQAIWWSAGTRISLSVAQFAPSCDMKACTGVGYDLSSFASVGFINPGCSQSQCKTTWIETGMAGCFQCPDGYMDCMGTCARGKKWYDCINPFNWDRVGYVNVGYDYTLPANDEGLL